MEGESNKKTFHLKRKRISLLYILINQRIRMTVAKLIIAVLMGGALMQPLFAAHNQDSGDNCQERFLEYEYDARWQEHEEPYFREEDIGADWPGKREDPFYDTLTR
jgi:hypothetical protein